MKTTAKRKLAKKISSNNKKIITELISFALVLMLGGAAAANAADKKEPAQKPLFSTGSTAAPNIMILYDDSTSMANVVASDSFGSGVMGTSALHPDDGAVTVLGTAIVVAPTDVTDPLAVMVRSHQINKLYYNPAITYEPWKGADGLPIVSRKSIDPKNAPTSVATLLGRSNIRGGHVDLTFVDKVYQFGVNFTTGGGHSMLRRYGMANPVGAYTFKTGVHSEKITPAIYFIYEGPGHDDPDFNGWVVDNSHIQNVKNYRPVIIANIPAGGEQQKDTRTDCGASIRPGTVQCSAEQEMLNFANWYVFYRDRIRASTGALTQVFAKNYGVKYRLGWRSLNNTKGGQQGVRAFELNNLHVKKFFNWLNSFEMGGANGGTPIPANLASIGNYFSTAEPWYEFPGQNPQGSEIACRRNYTIVITDGEWSGTTTIEGPNQNGTIITSPGGEKKYQYTIDKRAEDGGGKNYPYYSETGNDLASVAHYYWARDLRPNLDNVLPGTGYDGIAFWQNMITHTVGFGVTGKLRPSDWEALQTGEKTWQPGYGNRVDDLWHAAVVGHGTYSSVASLDGLIESISSILENISEGEAAGPFTAILSDQLTESGNFIYATQYAAGRWHGDLTAHPMVKGKPNFNSIKWQASAGVPDHASRNIWTGLAGMAGLPGIGKSKAVPFNWSDVEGLPGFEGLTSKEQVDFLRGDNSLANGATFRERTGTLGDIINSTPIIVQARPNQGYSALPRDATGGGYGGYNSYIRLMKERTGMIFVGANDGMLHAFDLSTGEEKFAYIPQGVLSKLPELAKVNYSSNHQYFVDGPLSLADAFWLPFPTGLTCHGDKAGNCWRNVLMGTAGAGAKSIFAIDVTRINQYTNNANVGDYVLWDMTEKDLPDLGYVMQPIQSGYIEVGAWGGSWVALSGNGAHSENGKAVLYVLDQKSGIVIKTITMPSSATNNGLMSVTLIKGKNQVIEGAYAGDLKGNLWKIDLRSNDIEDWSATKLFTTKDARPITHSFVTATHPLGGTFIAFGTGKFFDIQDTNDSGIDALYGIWDKQDGSSVKLSELVNRSAAAVPGSEGGLFKMTGDLDPIDWEKSRGWTLPLTMAYGQRSLYTPRKLGVDVIFDTSLTVPGEQTSESCEIQGANGITVTLNLFSGGVPNAQWDANKDGVVNTDDNNYIGFLNDRDGPGHTQYAPNLAGGSDILNNDPSMGATCEAGKILASDTNGRYICANPADANSHFILN